MGFVDQVKGILEERILPDVEVRIQLSKMGCILEECSSKKNHKSYKSFSSHILFSAAGIV